LTTGGDEGDDQGRAADTERELGNSRMPGTSLHPHQSHHHTNATKIKI
jgi:hypothetical protein